MLLQLENDIKLDIPAGQSDFLVTDKFTLPVDVNLLAIYPHAHYLGKDIQAAATLPDGSTKELIHIPRWNLNWQAVYRYAEPVFLPKGTAVELRYVYDNSDDNPLNPNHPPVRVRAGNRSSDEMCHLWLQVLPINYDPAQGDPRMLLQEALARHNVEKNPADFEAHYNLAAMLQARNKMDDARREYEFALRLRPRTPRRTMPWDPCCSPPDSRAKRSPICRGPCKRAPIISTPTTTWETLWPRRMTSQEPANNFNLPCKCSPMMPTPKRT